MRRLLPLLLIPLLGACAPATTRSDAGPLGSRPPVTAGPLVDSRLAFGLSYPEGTTTPGESPELDRALSTALNGTQYACQTDRVEHATLPDVGAFDTLGARLTRIGYRLTPIAADTYLFTRDFSVLAAHAHNLTLSLCETRW